MDTDLDMVKLNGKCTSAPITTSLNKGVLMKGLLRLSLTDGSFIDTKFYAFSRRRSFGVGDEPLPVYANSDILRVGLKYFDGC